MKKLLVYGTLREGDYNFQRVQNLFGPNSIKKIGERTLPGYAIFDLGHYPGLNQTGNEEDKVIFDVVEVNEKAAEFIERMEIGAGYVEQQVEDMTLYLYNYKLNPNSKIDSGNWLEYKQSTLRL